MKTTIRHRIGAALYSAELTAAATLETTTGPRALMLAWYHHIGNGVIGTTAAVVTGIAQPSAPALVTIAGLAALAEVFGRIADKSHDVLGEEDRPCRYCPPRPNDEEPGRGNKPIPDAPQPLAPLGDDRVDPIDLLIAQCHTWHADISNLTDFSTARHEVDR